MKAKSKKTKIKMQLKEDNVPKKLIQKCETLREINKKKIMPIRATVYNKIINEGDVRYK